MINKVIIDTDPGVDDALAIMFAIKKGINIIGITTVFGNADINNTTQNTLKILSIIGKNIPVYKGLGKPLKVENTFAQSHGIGGFGGYNILLNNNISKLDAIEYLIKELEKSNDKISIICLGPTTNIARLGILRPDLLVNIKEIIILGGVINDKGNITPYAEFNVYNDPDSLKLVLSFGLLVYLIPINVCRKVYFTLNDFNNINNKNISTSIKEITKHYIDYYQNDLNYGEFAGGIMYDLLATGFYTNKELFSYKDTYIDVVIDKLPNIGEIYENYLEKPNCKLINNVDSAKLKKLFFDTMNK